MAAAALLDYQIYEILLANGVWRAQTHNCNKFRQNRSFIAEILRFFKFSRWPLTPSWMFKISKFYWLLGSRGSRRICVPKFCQNRSIACEDITIFQIFKMAAVLHIGFVLGILGPPTVSTCGSLSLCKIWL